MTPKQKQFVDGMLTIHALCEMIINQYHITIADTNFKNPRIESKANKIREFANSITDKELRGMVTFKHKEEFKNDHVWQLHRLLTHFILKPTSALEEFADSLEQED